jgi:hypothetical protein
MPDAAVTSVNTTDAGAALRRTAASNSHDRRAPHLAEPTPDDTSGTLSCS